ncbi:MAG: aminotransferase class I/II-fold pyridoxal phosphate-dependent enzyme, partial [Parachlamydiaceae bacterium]|nr:aminotransferase class I/II-fold pyridoxal phosphate-dependent enzyme [Parachlamydiaceae bacterium]
MSFIIKLAENTISKEELNALAEWIKGGSQLTIGPLTKEFENNLAAFVGSKYAVMVNSGSSANLLMSYSLLSAGYLKNKKVIVPAISWITTLAPFIQLGFECFLCDADQNNLGLNVNHLEELCEKHKPSLIILVHVLGHLNNMAEINRICNKYGVLLIEDACEALGTTYNGQQAGNMTLCGSFSFYYGHHISTIEGGAVITNDRNLYNIMMSIRSHGWARDIEEDHHQKWKSGFDIDEFREYYSFYHFGYNLRPSDLNAFLGITQVKKLDLIVKRRQENYDWYKKFLCGKYYCQMSTYDILSSFAYGTFVKNRLEVYHHLINGGIETRPLI